MKKIILFGASGLLGTELRKLDNTLICPTSDEIDLAQTSVGDIFNYIYEIKPDIIINAAAKINNREIEENPLPAIGVNIIGAAKLAMVCQSLKIRLVYISTDYVYDGYINSYSSWKESDSVKPMNLYAETKLAGECSTKCVNDHLVIRTSFGAGKFPYEIAYFNNFTSKDYVDVIAPMIYAASVSDLNGVLNIGTGMKTMYKYASSRNDIEGRHGPCFIDTSLNLTKWNNFINEKNS